MSEEDLSAVPSDLLELISKRLLSWDDYVRSAPKRPHLLLFVVMNTRSAISPFFELCNFSDAELYTFCHISFFELCNFSDANFTAHNICGNLSRYYHIGTAVAPVVGSAAPSPKNRRSTIYLHNPFTGAQIRLPIMSHGAVPSKVVLSSDPTLDLTTVSSWQKAVIV